MAERLRDVLTLVTWAMTCFLMVAAGSMMLLMVAVSFALTVDYEGTNAWLSQVVGTL